MVLLSACGPRTECVIIPAVFRWKNDPSMNSGETEALERNRVQRVYQKILDIDWDPAHGAHPVSVVPVLYEWRNYGKARGTLTESIEFVPCIYITNNTFLKLDDGGTELLARKLLRKLAMERPERIHGVLLDCDWTERTKERFFRLAQIMNDSLDMPVSATIRLHQFARPEATGVPPVDRGMLMPYNVGQVSAPGDINSIFNVNAAKPYFEHTEPYPLPLDIAIPAFSWGAQFRKGRFMGILSEETMDEALTSGLLTGPMEGPFQVKMEDNDHLPQLHYGDVVRVERMTAELIREVTELARTAVNNDSTAIAFFELGATTFQRLDTSTVNSTLNAFGTVRYARTNEP